MAILIIKRGPNTGSRLSVDSFPARIGRDPSNELVLNDEECSRFHLKIKRRGQLYIIEDLDSRNGSYINGEKILNSILKNGDRIQMGATELLFVTTDAPLNFSAEMLDFDMHVAEEFGVNGPIDFTAPRDSDLPGLTSEYKPVRLNQESLVNQIDLNPNDIRNVFKTHSDIIIAENIEEAARSFLKHVPLLFDTAARAGFLLWSESTRQLMPLAAKHFHEKKNFIISRRGLEDVITRKQGVILPSATSTERGRESGYQIFLPLIQQGKVLGIVQIETEPSLQAISSQALHALQATLSRCASVFESYLLRQEIDSWLIGMVETMIATVEAKDTYTRGHSERVSKFSMAIADELKLDHNTKKLLMVSALCHDVGKIGIPDSILKKASLLSSDEYQEMKTHPTLGADIISHMPNSKRFISGVRHHHEKWDGTGYPDGLIGEEIPFFGRIVALADVYDAMVSGRSYSGFLNQQDAAERITEEVDLFDPEIIKAFARAHDKGTLTLKTETLHHPATGFRQQPMQESQSKQIKIKKSKKTE